MHRIIKEFVGYPFAHRQPNHKGHCSLIHGHNWDFIIELQSEKLDENGFVYDFGKFRWLKDYLTQNFDHTCLINADDPKKDLIMAMGQLDLMNIKIVPSCSCEGLAEMVYHYVNDYINNARGKGWEGYEDVRLLRVTVREDHKNSATYFVF